MDNDPAYNDSIIRVAIAEDHRLLRDSIVLLLAKVEGMELIIQSGNGEDFLKAIETNQKKPHVCLLDIRMPILNGFDTMKVIKKRWPAIKIIMLTSFIDELYVVKAISLGASGYLSKNIHPDEIKEAITTVHQGDYHIKNFINESTSLTQLLNDNPIPDLTAREIQLLELSHQELSWAEVAGMLNTTVKSVEGTRDALYRKLNVKSKVGLALAAMRLGIVLPESPGITIL